MATSNSSRLFEVPKFRQLLAIILLIWLGLITLMGLAEASKTIGIDFNDPLLTPFFYLILFGGSSLWVIWQYRRRRVDLQAILGFWPAPVQWKPLLGVWLILFIFSLGAFQVSFALLSYVFPEPIEQVLQDSIFLTAGETAVPWLYNILMFGILVVAAPVLEEFLFRGFLLHRWGTRWSVKTAVLLSSLLFGVLHSNIIGLTAFGMVMALLYLRSGSLGLVIFVHALNNAIAASLEILARLTGNTDSQSLAEFRASLWFGIALLAVSTPFLIRFFRHHWSLTQATLPYFVNRDQRMVP